MSVVDINLFIMIQKTKKFFHKSVFVSAFLFALALLAVKMIVVPTWLEFIDPISIYTSLLSSVIFIYGFILSPVMQEYKESERLKIDLKNSIQNIYAEILYIHQLKPAFSPSVFLEEFFLRLEEIFYYIADDIDKKDTHEYVRLMSEQLLLAEQLGVPANHIIKLKQEISTFNRVSYRMIEIKDHDAIPHIIHQLKNFITVFVLGTLLFLNVGTSAEDTVFVQIKEGIVVFFVSFLYLYLSLIISNLENPFDKRHFSGYIDMSFLKEFIDKVQHSQK